MTRGRSYSSAAVNAPSGLVRSAVHATTSPACPKFPAPSPTGVGSVPGVKSAGLELRIPVPLLAQPAPEQQGMAPALSITSAPASSSVSSATAASARPPIAVPMGSPVLAPQLAQTGTEDLPQLGLVGGALLLIGVACTTAARRLRRQI